MRLFLIIVYNAQGVSPTPSWVLLDAEQPWAHSWAMRASADQ